MEERVSESVWFDSTQHQLADFYLRLHGLRQGPNTDVFQVVKSQRNGPLDTLEEGGQGKRAEALLFDREVGAVGDGSKVACQLKRVQQRPVMNDVPRSFHATHRGGDIGGCGSKRSQKGL